jgi:hypothetical protein
LNDKFRIVEKNIVQYSSGSIYSIMFVCLFQCMELFITAITLV